MAAKRKMTVTTKMRVFNSQFYGGDETGYPREYEWDEEVEDLGCGAGRIPCPGCCADGPISDDERDNDDLGCVECKDTGRVLVSI